MLATRAKTLHVEGKTKTALQLLRLRKYKLQEADRVEEQLLTVLRLVDKIAEKQNEQEVVVALTVGTDALQKMHDEMGIEDVLDLMDKVRDQNEVQRTINEVLERGGMTVSDELAEEEALEELKKLEEEVRMENATTQQVQSSLPELNASMSEEADLLLPKTPQNSLPDAYEISLPEPEPTIEKVAIAS